MGGYGSGGANRKSAAAHVLEGTWRRDRHAQKASHEPVKAVSAADRRRTLADLPAEARRIAASLLGQYGGWDAASLATLRHYARSCARLEELRGDDAERRREVRANLNLLRALNLEHHE